MRSIPVSLVAFTLLALPASAGKKAEATPPPPKAPAGAPFEMESHSFILLVRVPNAPVMTDDSIAALQEKHLAHLTELANAGKILIAGPFDEQMDETLRGACIYSVPLAEAVKLAEDDPMVKAGRLKVVAMTWWTGKGYLAFPKAKAPQ